MNESRERVAGWGPSLVEEQAVGKYRAGAGTRAVSVNCRDPTEKHILTMVKITVGITLVKNKVKLENILLSLTKPR